MSSKIYIPITKNTYRRYIKKKPRVYILKIILSRVKTSISKQPQPVSSYHSEAYKTLHSNKQNRARHPLRNSSRYITNHLASQNRHTLIYIHASVSYTRRECNIAATMTKWLARFYRERLMRRPIGLHFPRREKRHAPRRIFQSLGRRARLS